MPMGLWSGLVGEREDGKHGQSQKAAFQVAHGEAAYPPKSGPGHAWGMSAVSRAEALPSGVSALWLLSGSTSSARQGSLAVLPVVPLVSGRGSTSCSTGYFGLEASPSSILNGERGPLAVAFRDGTPYVGCS